MAEPHAVIPSHFNPTVYEAIESADNVIFFKWDLTDDTFNIRETETRHHYALPESFSRASTRLALDGIVHPDDAGLLEYYMHRIYHSTAAQRRHNHLSARLRLRGSRQIRWIWSEIHLITYYQGHHPRVAFGKIRNIQAEKLWQERVFRRANTDDMTGLLNKGAVKTHIRAALRKMNPQKDAATLLIVDADDFKAVNDTFGHLFGDKVLREVGLAINKNFRQSDIKGRIGGDEFVILLPGMESAEVLQRHCLSLCRRLYRIFHHQGKTQAFSISIGAAQYPRHGKSYTELIRHADHALYEAKRRGKGQYVLYHADLSETAASISGRNADTMNTVSTEQSPQSESIDDLLQRLEDMQHTIDCMGKMMCALMKTKT